MNQIKLRKWSSAEHLKTERDLELYLKTSLQEGGNDPAFMEKVKTNIAKAKATLASKPAHS